MKKTAAVAALAVLLGLGWRLWPRAATPAEPPDEARPALALESPGLADPPLPGTFRVPLLDASGSVELPRAAGPASLALDRAGNALPQASVLVERGTGSSFLQAGEDGRFDLEAATDTGLRAALSIEIPDLELDFASLSCALR